MPLSFKVRHCYPSSGITERWRGQSIDDAAEFDLYLKGPVHERVSDAAFVRDFAADLSGLSTTGMATDALMKVLVGGPDPLDWEIGEAIAENLLHDEFGASWPWNENRDRKTPKASLPGADLVGFIGDGDEVRLLFGEVKTSSDPHSPPGVLNGRSGLVHQIDLLANRKDIHACLIRWLHARCKGTPFWAAYQAAVSRYFRSDGQDIALVGILIRDTSPSEDDLRSRGQALDGATLALPRMRLDAWYVPRKIGEWANTIMGKSA